MKEIWKDIPDWPGYKVSNLGRAIGKKGRILSPRYCHGYPRIAVVSNKKVIDLYVHQWVCILFNGGKPGPYYEVDHINDTPADCRASNLQWLTISQNRAKRRMPCGENHASSKLTEVMVRDILTRPRHLFNNRQLAKEFNISREQIRDIRNRKEWKWINV